MSQMIKRGVLLANTGEDNTSGDANTLNQTGTGNTGISSGTGTTSTGTPGTGASVANKPKLIISNYKLTPEMPKAGEEFTMNLTFYNTNSVKSVRNIKISLNGSEIGQTAEGKSASGSVFSPVNSSNTFYIKKIMPGKTNEKEIKLKTVPNAVAQNYTMNISFEYEDIEGNEFTATEVIGIPVVQTSEVLLGEAKVGGEMGSENLQVGAPVPIDLDFYNTGKDTLTNFMVTIEGQGFRIEESPRYFVGNFAPGSSDHYSASITAEEAGKIQGNIVITYEDSAGESHRKEMPIQATLTDTVASVPDGFEIDPETGNLINHTTGETLDPVTMMPVEAGKSGKLPFSPLWLVLVGCVLILGIVLFFRHRHKKTIREQELEIDA